MSTPSKHLPVRKEIPEDKTWNLELMYATPSEWEKDFGALEELAGPLERLRGTIQSPAALLDFFRADERMDRALEKLYVYAHLREDEDTALSESQERMARIRAKWADVSTRTAWFTPEILAHDLETLLRWSESPELAAYRHTLAQLIRRKPHTLSEAEETLLAGASEVMNAPYQIFNFLTNADLTFPDITDSQGQTHTLSEGRYRVFLESPDRDLRKAAFDGLFRTYSGVRNTLACSLGTLVKRNNFNARVRHHASAVDAALHPDGIPTSLYTNLISGVRANLPRYFDYLELRRRRLGLDALDIFDLYIPIVPDCNRSIPYEQACTWILDAVRPLGEEYVRVATRAFSDRWVDVLENKGKRSGAYSSGCYDSLPYMLMNYNGTLNEVFTLAHELGHSMHSWLANRAQPHHVARYPIFIAEIASTLNEALLLDHLLDIHTDDPVFRAFLLNHYCDGFKGTVYRQTMFAEFEKMLHEMDASGQALSADSISRAYHQQVCDYHGPATKPSAIIANEWARIPHFYYNFYVYKYATSFCASQLFIRQVRKGGDGVARYLDLLRAGGSGFPLDLVKTAGVDLTDPSVIAGAFEGFSAAAAQLGVLLDSMPLDSMS